MDGNEVKEGKEKTGMKERKEGKNDRKEEKREGK